MGEIGTGWEGQAPVPLPTAFLSLRGPSPVHQSLEPSGPSLASEASLWQHHSRGPAQTPGKAGLALGGCLIIMFLFPKLFPGKPSETGSGRPMLKQTHMWGVARHISSGIDPPSLPSAALGALCLL